MSEATGIQVATQPRRSLRAGGAALAIVPQTIDDVWKVARYIQMGKMAPDSLTKGRDPDEQTAAIATIIMSGLELGLSPMVAMRSFGMINNRPGLYGDGLINVCRRHETAEYVKLGFQPGADEMFGDDAFGYCEAKRRDTGEVAREEFSVGDAKRAGLWSPEAKTRGQIWKDKQRVWVDDAPNESPWHRYPKRMLQWRAAGYNLRNLFADVLGGIPTMDEIEEIEREEEMRDVTPTTQITRSTRPPSPPADDDFNNDTSGVIDEPDGENNYEDPANVLAEVEDALRDCTTVDEVEENFDALDVQTRLASDNDLAKAFAIRNRRLQEVEPGEDEQDDEKGSD